MEKKREFFFYSHYIVLAGMITVPVLIICNYFGSNFWRIFEPILFASCSCFYWYFVDQYYERPEEKKKRKSKKSRKKRRKKQKPQNENADKTSEEIYRMPKDEKAIGLIHVTYLLVMMVSTLRVFMFFAVIYRGVKEKLWWLFFGMALLAAFSGMLYFLTRKIKTPFSLVMVAAVPFASLVLEGNQIFDMSQPRVEEVRIVELKKDTLYGANGAEGSDYSITVRLDGRYQEFGCGSSVYRDYQDKDTIIIGIHDGLYGVTWYEIPYDD